MTLILEQWQLLISDTIAAGAVGVKLLLVSRPRQSVHEHWDACSVLPNLRLQGEGNIVKTCSFVINHLHYVNWLSPVGT
jgi:hypothetical protein